MKKALFIVLTLAMAMLSNTIYADNKENTDVPIFPNGSKPTDTSSTSNNISCQYRAGALYISFAMPEGKATLTVTHLDSGEKNKETFLTYRPYTTWIGSNTGMYQIGIDTTHGGKYIGYLTID